MPVPIDQVGQVPYLSGQLSQVVVVQVQKGQVHQVAYLGGQVRQLVAVQL